MSNSNATRLTKEEFLSIIENYRNHGRDTTELEKFLQEAFPETSKNETASVNQMVAELWKKSPVTQGKCSLCGAEGTLISDVCEKCFVPWATRVSEDSIARMRRNKQREKF
jgi:hypothetical protein